MGRRAARAFAAACCMASAGIAFAQGQVLVPGAMVSGDLARNDEGPVVVPLQLEPGQSVRLDAFPGPDERKQLDLFLRVLDPVGNLVGEADDNEGSLNPRVDFSSPSGGRYAIEIGAYSSGTFSLIARESRPKVATQLEWMGGFIEQTIEFPDAEGALFTVAFVNTGSYDLTLSPKEGGSVDPVLELFSGNDLTVDPAYRDDDSLGNLGSRIVADVPVAGTYTIRVSNISEPGEATLKVAPIRDQVVEPIELPIDGPPRQVQISEDSPIIFEDAGRRFSPYALFRLPEASTLRELVQAGAQVIIRAESSDLDPYLEVGFFTPFGFNVALSNDDDAVNGTVNSVIVIDPAVLLNSQRSEDPEAWWKQLRIRASAPAASGGEMQVSVSTGETTKAR
jgi:hypothetical protein